MFLFFPFRYPALNLLDPLRVLLHLAFDEVVAVFAVTEAVASRHVVIVLKRAIDIGIVVEIESVFLQKLL